MERFGTGRGWLRVVTVGVALMVIVSVQGEDLDGGDDPINGFSLQVGGETVGLFQGNTKVIEEGKMVGKWGTCNPTRGAEDPKKDDSCAHLLSHAFRAAFSFFYEGPPMSVGDPLVMVSNPSVSAEIDDFDHDQVEQAGDFYVKIDCSRAPGVATYVTVLVEDVEWDEGEGEGEGGDGNDDDDSFASSAVRLPNTAVSRAEEPGAESAPVITFQFSFVMLCGSGDLPELTVSVAGEDLTSDELQSVEGLVVPETTKVSRFLVTMEEPLRYVSLSAPVLKAGAAVKILLRGSLAFGGSIESWDRGDLILLYTCESKDDAVSIQISFPIPPFNPKVISFVKKCGSPDMFDSEEGFLNEAPVHENEEDGEDEKLSKPAAAPDTAQQKPIVPMFQRLRIGTSDFVEADIWSEGTAAQRFALSTAEMETSAVPSGLMVYGRSRSSLNLFMWNADDEQRLGYDLLEVTTSPSDVLRAFVEPPASGGLMGSTTVGPYNVDIGGGDKIASLRMVCRGQGTAKVLVTMLLKTGRTVEFGFLKECEAPRRIQKRGFLRTAGSLFSTVALAFFGAAIYLLVRYGKQARQAVSDYNRVRVRQA